MGSSTVHDVYRKSNFIADDLRTQIIEGIYQPGDRLPTRDELVAHYAVSKVTVQRAYEQLKHDGFTLSKVGSGTIVAPNSPHLTRYAMLFPQSQEATGHNQFWYALAQEAQRLKDGREVELHYGFDGRQGIERFQKLIQDVENRRLAGLIFTSPPLLLAGTPLLDQPGIPRVCFMAPTPSFKIPAVTMDGAMLRRKMAEHALNCGAQRIALIASDQMSVEAVAEVVADFERLGLSISSEWVHGVSNIRPAWGGALVRLLMSGPAASRPDCLIVLDDNLVPEISKALKSLGLIPPLDLELITHCNFPWPTPSAVPAVRVGFCITECLDALLRQIDAQHLGKPAKPLTVIPAYHQTDYTHPIHTQA